MSMRLDRVERADDLELLVAHRVSARTGGRLHRDQAQKLHQVVLHHVAHRAEVS
jgi:hypothetical protein